MRVLIACEESQEVCKAFRALGHEAYSCDIQEPSGGHPEWHIQGDALKFLSPGWLPDLAHGDQRWGIEFCTMDKAYHIVDQWDLLIAHPPCTHLAVSGARWFAEGKKLRSLQDDAAEFFMAFVRADVPKIAIENPVSVMSTRYRKPDQIIHPWQFGHPEEKTTCLWLFGLPKLTATCVVRDEMMALPKKMRERNHYMSPSEERAKMWSKTYPGIARAMAEQWGG